jgi:hypothetical protein
VQRETDEDEGEEVAEPAGPLDAVDPGRREKKNYLEVDEKINRRPEARAPGRIRMSG